MICGGRGLSGGLDRERGETSTKEGEDPRYVTVTRECYVLPPKCPQTPTPLHPSSVTNPSGSDARTVLRYESGLRHPRYRVESRPSQAQSGSGKSDDTPRRTLPSPDSPLLVSYRLPHSHVNDPVRGRPSRRRVAGPESRSGRPEDRGPSEPLSRTGSSRRPSRFRRSRRSTTPSRDVGVALTRPVLPSAVERTHQGLRLEVPYTSGSFDDSPNV